MDQKIIFFRKWEFLLKTHGVLFPINISNKKLHFELIEPATPLSNADHSGSFLYEIKLPLS